MAAIDIDRVWDDDAALLPVELDPDFIKLPHASNSAMIRILTLVLLKKKMMKCPPRLLSIMMRIK